MALTSAAANGDLRTVQTLVREGADCNEKSRDGMTALCVAAFWGYAEIVKELLKNGANINLQNNGTGWSAIHCAAFQGHGKVIMTLMEYKPDLSLKDSQGRTAADFASALDSIWSFFAAAGCSRTSKNDLIKLKIVQKVHVQDPSLQMGDYAHFSRPGSSYAMRSQPMHGDHSRELASVTGDVLSGVPEEPEAANRNSPVNLAVFRN